MNACRRKIATTPGCSARVVDLEDAIAHRAQAAPAAVVADVLDVVVAVVVAVAVAAVAAVVEEAARKSAGSAVPQIGPLTTAARGPVTGDKT